ncbi:tape measure protein, partial [Massilia sp. CCM 8734]|uniref:tape measure protein n=1 Tax=Massilia sp. CCM 8734 TaxID=2609283 RepID=UPI00142017D6
MIVGDMEIRLRADIARLQRDMDSARRVVGDATTSISRAADMAKAALAGIAAGVGLSQLVQMSDAYAKFTAQLRLASTSAREYAAAYADVKRIATTSQQGLAETGVLYARIANGTRELGTSQKQVAAITEVVNMSLKVSGASASESASAQLQLSQAFASGTLRGEEFNAVNEAAPRLMKALADGMGLPVGALKKMAEEGKITSNVMATVLPDALEKVRKETAQVQTISGAFTVLKNNLMEMVGVQANASGAVAGLTGAIGLLSSNLAGVAWAMSTMIAIKATNWLATLVTDAYAAAAAKRALAAATLQAAVTTTEAAAVAAAAKLTEAQANMQVAASTANLTAARVTELRAAVLATSGATQLAIVQNGLIPAQLRAAAAAEAHALALAAQAVAANGATTASLANTAAITAQATAATFTARAVGVLRGGLALIGGPIGAIILALSLGALAWSKWGKDAKESSEKALESFDEAQARIVKGLDEQIDKNEKLLRLKNLGMTTAAAEKAIPVTDQLGAASRRLNALNTRTGEFDPNKTGMSNNDIDREREKTMQSIAELSQKMQKVEKTGAAVAVQSSKEKIDAVLKEYATKNEQRDAELKAIEGAKGKVAGYDEAVKRIREKYADKGNASAIKAEATAYQNLMTSIAEKVAANKLELEGYDKLSESQKMTIKLNAEIKTSKNMLSNASIANTRAEIANVAAQEALIASRAADVSWAEKSSAANAEVAESLSKATMQLRADALAQKDHNDQIGLGKMALADLEAQRYEHLASVKDENAALAEAIDFSGTMSQAY